MRTGWRRRLGPYLESARAIRENRDRPGYALRILRNGVGDGFALGTSWLSDWTIPEIHLCRVRLNLPRLSTCPPFGPAERLDAGALAERGAAGLRAQGRIPWPLIRRRREAGFRPLERDAVLELIAERWRKLDPRRLAFYAVSRGTVNETYDVVQKAARLLGTNPVDNSARICHAPSTVGLERTIGFAATTWSCAGLIGSALVVLIGSDVANKQPVMVKYLHLAKKRGTKVAVIDPFREPGLDRYFVPSNLESALRGAAIRDAFFQIRAGGDIAFINGALENLIENDWCDRRFIADQTGGWPQLENELTRQEFPLLELSAGASRAEMLELPRLHARSRTAVIVWSTGLTMHRRGVDNVVAITNLALSRGHEGREKTGLMPIRGHSGVQGGAEMGCVPNALPGAGPVDARAVASVGHCAGMNGVAQPNVVNAILAPGIRSDAGRLSRHVFTTSSCGVCGKSSLEQLEVAIPGPPSGSFTLAPPRFLGLIGCMSEHQPLFDRTGGLQATAPLDRSGRTIAAREDVGRHNAIDKLIGSPLLADRLPAAETSDVGSGRASFERVQNALMAGLPMLAAVGAPSSLAVELARRHGMTLIGFLGTDHFHVYRGAQRVGADRGPAEADR